MEVGIISLIDLTADPHTGRPVAALDRLDDTLAHVRAAGELCQLSAYTHDDLVFCHPQTGRPYDASKSRVASSRRSSAPASARCASTTSGTRTER